VDVKSLDVATGCQKVTGNKCHSGPKVQWTFRGGLNVTRTLRGWTFRQGTKGQGRDGERDRVMETDMNGTGRGQGRGQGQ
jgi:hypothetical protein